MLLSTICKYLGSNIFRGTVVLGKMIKLDNGKTGNISGRSSFS